MGPETVRRLACDGALVAGVVGEEDQVVGLGPTRRFFSSRQLQVLWRRDRQCTFRGCRTPTSWADAHHVTHRADGGATMLANAALLCGRHHTVVHRDRLFAEVTPSGVVWDRRIGSYDRALTATARAREPPPDG